MCHLLNKPKKSIFSYNKDGRKYLSWVEFKSKLNLSEKISGFDSNLS